MISPCVINYLMRGATYFGPFLCQSYIHVEMSAFPLGRSLTCIFTHHLKKLSKVLSLNLVDVNVTVMMMMMMMLSRLKNVSRFIFTIPLSHSCYTTT